MPRSVIDYNTIRVSYAIYPRNIHLKINSTPIILTSNKKNKSAEWFLRRLTFFCFFSLFPGSPECRYDYPSCPVVVLGAKVYLIHSPWNVTRRRVQRLLLIVITLFLGHIIYYIHARRTDDDNVPSSSTVQVVRPARDAFCKTI